MCIVAGSRVTVFLISTLDSDDPTPTAVRVSPVYVDGVDRPCKISLPTFLRKILVVRSGLSGQPMMPGSVLQMKFF